MDEKAFELLTKMYSEMQEMKSEIKEMKQDISNINHTVVRIENIHGKRLEALFEGIRQYMRNSRNMINALIP